MLDDISYKTLLQLYQPIMGMEAVSLYMTLYSELDQITLTKSPSLISRLCKMTGFSLNELSQSLSKLEAIGLMSSYKKKSQENRFLFDLKMPYLPHEFLNHPILNDLLQQRLKDEYKKTVSVNIINRKKETAAYSYRQSPDISYLIYSVILMQHLKLCKHL